MIGFESEGFGHESHDVRLGYGLLIADWERFVVVGLVLQLFWYKSVAGYFTHGSQDSFVFHGRAFEEASGDLHAYHTVSKSLEFVRREYRSFVQYKQAQHNQN